MMKLNRMSSLVLAVAGAASAQAATINLSPSWNLLGYSEAADVVVADSFGDANNVTSVWSWNTATAKWAFYSPAFADGGLAYSGTKGYDFLTTIKSGNGFWVNSKTSFTAELPLPPVVNPIALAGITAGLTTFQNLFATSVPAETDTTLVGLIDNTMLEGGSNKAAFLHAIVTGDGPTPGFQVIPGSIKLVRPLDPGAAPNDASHQWFTFGVTPGGGPENAWLAIKDGNGNWLLAGNQRMFDLTVRPRGVKQIPSQQQANNGAQVSYHNEIVTDLGTSRLQQLNVSLVVLTGTGVRPTDGVTLYTSSAPGQQQHIEPCDANRTTNCIDATSVGAGARYTFKAYTVNGGSSVPAYNYTNALATAPLSPASLALAAFPTITYVTPTWTPGGSVLVNWTLPVGSTSEWIGVNGWPSQGGSLFNVGSNPAKTATSATLQLPNYDSTMIAGKNVWLNTRDASGNKLSLDYEM